LHLKRSGSDMIHTDMLKMNCQIGRRSDSSLTGVLVLGTCALLTVILAAGCGGSGKKASRTGALAGIRPPKPPAFLNGPMALLLTNVDGYSARVVLERGATANGSELANGQLLSQGGRLLFAPGVLKSSPKGAKTEDCAYIWDVAGNRGVVLNDPLQGYAPLSYGRHFTNLATSASPTSASTENVAGHPCQQSEVIVAADDGSASAFRVWRARDLKGLPVRISGASDGLAVTLTLTKVRLETLPADLFQPPSGFAKFDSVEVMVNEISSRQQKLKQRTTPWPEDNEPLPAPDVRAPTRLN
jgi:hypothetical protein